MHAAKFHFKHSHELPPHTLLASKHTQVTAGHAPNKVDLVLSSGFLSFANHAGFLKAVEEVCLASPGLTHTKLQRRPAQQVDTNVPCARAVAWRTKVFPSPYGSVRTSVHRFAAVLIYCNVSAPALCACLSPDACHNSASRWCRWDARCKASWAQARARSAAAYTQLATPRHRHAFAPEVSASACPPLCMVLVPSTRRCTCKSNFFFCVGTIALPRWQPAARCKPQLSTRAPLCRSRWS